MKTLPIGDFELTWLSGGKIELDGGAMFGVVPKTLWQKKYPVDAENYIPITASPILVKTPKALVLIESGIGNKLTDKQKKIFRVREEWALMDDLARLGMEPGDIDFVILTHYDFDHAGGVIMQDPDGRFSLSFPKAKHILQKTEWDDVLNPNVRNINTYWPINNEAMKGNEKLHLVSGDAQIAPGISVHRTGGHTNGHQIVKIESQGESALHLADLLPTHAHANPLWVMAYDNYPMDSIAKKEALIKDGVRNRSWFTFYHDATLLACKFDAQGLPAEKHEA